MCFQLSRSSPKYTAEPLTQKHWGAQKAQVSLPKVASFQSNTSGVPSNCLLPYTRALFKTDLIVGHLLLPSATLFCFKAILFSLKSKRFSSFKNAEREATIPTTACLPLLQEPQRTCRQNCKSATVERAQGAVTDMSHLGQMPPNLYCDIVGAHHCSLC